MSPLPSLDELGLNQASSLPSFDELGLVEPSPEPQKPPGFWNSGIGKEMGGVADLFLEGAAGTAGLIGDVAQSRFNPLSPNYGRPKWQADASYTDVGKGILDFLGENNFYWKQEPETLPGKVIGYTAKYAPTGLLGPGTTAAKLGATALSGLGAGTARQMFPESEYSELAGAIGLPVGLAATTGTIKGLIGPQTSKGIDRRVGATLKRLGVNEIGDASIAPGQLGSKTLAEVSDAPILPQLQDELASRIGDGRVLQAQDARVAARESLLSPLGREGVDAVEAGSVMGPAFKSARAKEDALVDELYKSIDDKMIVPMKGLGARILDDMDGLFGPGAPKINEEVEALASDVLGFGDNLPLVAVKNLKTRAGDIKERLFSSGGKNTPSARFADKIKNHLDDYINRLAEGSDEVGALPEAVSARRALGDKFDRGALKKLQKQVGYGEFDVADSQIAKLVLRRPEDTKRFVESVGKDSDAAQALREYLLNEIKNQKGRAPTWYQKNRAQVEAAFGDAADTVKKYVDDIASESTVVARGKAGSLKGSPSAQRLVGSAVGKAGISRFVGPAARGLLGLGGAATAVANLPLALGLGLTGLAAGGLKARSNRLIQQKLFDALSYPELAKTLLSQAPASRLPQALRTLGTGLLAAPSSSQPESGSANPKASSLQPRSELPLDLDLMDTKVTKDAPLVKAIIQAESSKNPDAVSPVGAKGLMQIMDATGEELFQKAGLKGEYDPFDPEQNVTLGTMYINELLDMFGDERTALAAYNAGMGNVRKAMKKANSGDFDKFSKFLPKPEETIPYVERVLRFKNKLEIV